MSLCLSAIGLPALSYAPALADPPVPGARYVTSIGFDSDAGADAVLRVARRADSLVSGSYLTVRAGCRLDRDSRIEGRIGLGPRGTRKIRIARDGSFSFARRRGSLRVVGRGRFDTSRIGDRVKLVISARERPDRPRHPERPGICTTGRRELGLFRDGEPRFSGCRTQRATNLAEGPTGRIFEQFAPNDLGDLLVPHPYACLYETDRRFHLGQNYDDLTIRRPRLAGPFAAYLRGLRIHVMDLRDGRIVRRISGLLWEWVADFVLNDNGSVGWLAARGTGVDEVGALDSAGYRVLDVGADIEQASLTLDGSTLSWRNGGEVRSATLD